MLPTASTDRHLSMAVCRQECLFNQDANNYWGRCIRRSCDECQSSNQRWWEPRMYMRTQHKSMTTNRHIVRVSERLKFDPDTSKQSDVRVVLVKSLLPPTARHEKHHLPDYNTSPGNRTVGYPLPTNSEASSEFRI